MNDQFDELARGLAQSVTRRGALKKFGVGLAGIVLASLGLANKAFANSACRACVKSCTASGGSTKACKEGPCYVVCHGYGP